MLEKYITSYLEDIKDFQVIFKLQEQLLDELNKHKEYLENNLLISSSSLETVKRLENFLDIVENGNLDQRKDFIISSLILTNNKLNKEKIKDVVYTITKGNALIRLITADQEDNELKGHCILEIIVQNPLDEGLFNNVRRILEPLMPCHINLIISKYYSSWGTIKDNFTWEELRNLTWLEVEEYIELEKHRKELYESVREDIRNNKLKLK